MTAAPRSISCPRGRLRSCRSRAAARRSYGPKRRGSRAHRGAAGRCLSCRAGATLQAASRRNQVIGARRVHPLGFFVARAFIAERIALIGDAAHVIHPIAGQGLNMGLKDVAALAEVIVDAARLGLDPVRPTCWSAISAGGASTPWRWALPPTASTGCSPTAPMCCALVRDVGLGLVDRLPESQAAVHPRSGGTGRRSAETAARRSAIVARNHRSACMHTMAFNHIAVIGAGAWGTALALTCARAGRKVTLWEHDAANAAQLAQQARKPVSARRAASTTASRVAGELAEAARAEAMLLVVPAQAVRAVATALRAAACAGHAADRLRQGHRARQQKIHERSDRRMRARAPCRQFCRDRASPPTWRAACRPR